MNLRACRAVVGAFVIAFSASGCYVDSGHGEYPKGRKLLGESIARQWRGEGRVKLNPDGSFSAEGLKLQYFECSLDGISEKTGSGSWGVEDGRDATRVDLRFLDGCSASLWVGEIDKGLILWSVDTETDQVSIFKS